MSEPTTTYEQRDAVAVITINRPDAMNSFNAQLRADLLAALERAAADDSVRVVVLTGSGRSFSAGADLNDLSNDRRVDESLQKEYRPILECIEDSREYSGNDLIDEAVLRDSGVTDFDRYATDLSSQCFSICWSMSRVSDSVSSKPLAGIRVLDLTRLLPGPVCSLHLADMGADVIKIEDPERGDYSRHRRGDVSAGLAQVFDQVNRNKRSLKLDLKQPEGVRAFMDLVAEAHVVMEGFRPGVMTRLGIDFPQMRDRNPAIVFCAISGYGQDGPLRDVAGHDINYCGYAGVLHQCGARDGPPSPTSDCVSWREKASSNLEAPQHCQFRRRP